MKKRIICAALLAAMVCTAASCGDNKPAESVTSTTAAAQTDNVTQSDFTASDVTKAILDEVPIHSAFEKSASSTVDEFDLDDDMAGKLVDSSYVIGSTDSPEEMAVFRFDSADTAESAVAKAQEKLERQENYYRNYSPEEAYKLDDAVIEQSGEWLFYLITGNNTRAKEIALSFMG